MTSSLQRQPERGRAVSRAGFGASAGTPGGDLGGSASRPPASASSLPAQIGKYRVLRKLGEGATSEVYLALDPFHQTEVAIKRVRRGLLPGSRDAHYQQRFFDAEAALVGQLKHPNVVQIFDAVADVELPYLVMEYVSGGTLRRYCRPDSLLPMALTVEIGFKCAKALGYCYQHGLIHRDVKPANLLVQLGVNPNGNQGGHQLLDVKVTDFGSVFNQQADATQVFRVGSLAYMSPEQLDGSELDCRADIYSLGAVLYHLVSGRAPFDAQHQQAMIQQIYHGVAPPLHLLRDKVPPALQSLIERCLAKERVLRPTSWDEVAQSLSALVAAGQVPRAGLQEVLDSERFTLLRGLEFFADFGDVELWEVVHRANWQRHAYGEALYRKGDGGNSFHIIAQGEVRVLRDGAAVATLGAGTSVGEMAYLAPNPQLAVHSVDILVSKVATTLSFSPQHIDRLSLHTRHRFDKAFIGVLVRRLHAAHEALAHPRRIM